MTRIVRAADLIGMPVVTLDSATMVGEVRDVLFDPRTSNFVGFTLRGRGLLSPPFVGLLPASAIGAIGHDAVTISSAGALLREREDVIAALGDKHDAIGTEVVTETGASVGNITDIVIELNSAAPAVVGYCVENADGLEVIVPASDAQRGWGEVVVVPGDVDRRAVEGLSGFRDLLERSRAGGAGRP